MTYEEFLKQWRDTGTDVQCRTSGSTGTPKSILLPKTEMSKSALRTVRHFGLDRFSHLHSCISPDFIGGKMMAVRAEETGARLTWETPSNRPLMQAGQDAIDLLAVVPSQMEYILSHMDMMPEIRAIIIGGSAIPAALRRRIEESGLNAWETYGMTETASHIALRRVTDPPSPFRVLDGISTGVDGESRLVIEMEGWQKIVTNDIVRIIGQREFVVTGRYDNVIISGGIKIHPEQAEEILEATFGVPVLITSVPDNKWGERVIMIIEDGEDRASDTIIISRCKECLPKAWVPKEILHQNVPTTENGKKKRKNIL